VTEPEFLDVDDVLAIHDEALAAFGGSAGVRDAGLLASAVAMPQASFGGELLHEDLFAMAAAYAFHLAQNQPFVDGNKRTAILAAIVFLDINGVEIPEATDELYDAMIGIAERRLGKEDVSAALRRLGVPR
jgi:death-on-curing protein